MRIAVHDNRQNGQPLFDALEHAGHELSRERGDVLLTDSDDVTHEPYRTLCEAHERVFLHPHGAGLVIPSDTHRHTRGAFVSSRGQAYVLVRSHFPGHIAIIGWHFCALRPFRPCPIGVPLRVLLAPTHAMADGTYDAHLPTLNARLHRLLAFHPRVRLTVRYVHGFAPLGIERLDHVQYIEGDGMVGDAVRAIDDADLVIAGAWTLPTLAVARGVPTLMYGTGSVDANYAQTIRYPYDADLAHRREDIDMLMRAVATQDRHVDAWRATMIGAAYHPGRFVEQFERAVAFW